MAEHIPALPEQMIVRARFMIMTAEYEKTCVSRVNVSTPGQVFGAIKKA
ncbi:hypothetical protein GCM10008018_01780 [Paenibacillus marchantiophytorum]|uniref:Uncharacterized protein n=1 Tax=Paenibacillus marchantiophytorum TaxID=1619310 RepID=A0ABQ2BMR0_9BACL|nr:hypothetical protein [Paenibacillus marchantiophytorum]GGI43380.1 hypothetical protein GCM10008018_01780 [Paenibacillus marchantiophytorum]